MNRQWLEKAVFTTADVISPAGGGVLSPQQAREFIRVAIEASRLVADTNVFTSSAPKFEVPRISFANRILRVGVEAERVASADRVKPVTGLVTLSTVLFKGEVPMSDELLEDNLEKDALADTIATMIAEAVGRDIEEIVIKADTARTALEDAVLDQQDGLVKQMQTDLPSAQKIDGGAHPTYTGLFAAMIGALPSRYRRNYAQLRFYVPVPVRDGYIGELAARGTPLGDTTIIEGQQARLAFRGIPVIEVPLMSGTSTINGSAIDYSRFALLLHPSNVYMGFHRRVRVERYRDPREGVTSFLPTVRFDMKIGDPSFGVLAYDVPAAA